MQRTPTPELDKVFTYAESSYATDVPDLVFSSLKGDENILSAESLLNIARDRLTRVVLGTPFVVMALDRKPPTVLATGDFEYVIDRLERAKYSTRMAIGDSNTCYLMEPAKIFDNCHLPHKLIVGCRECISDHETTNHCQPKESVLNYAESDSALDLDDMENWKHREAQLNGFTYISPMLTAPKNIAKRARTLKEHDFSYVAERSQIKSEGLKERYRRERFYKNECSRCFVKEKCLAYQPRSGWAGCEGPYLYTEEEATKQILEGTIIPFTNAQFIYLLNHSGELPRRVHRYKHAATFYRDGRILKFGHQRLTDPCARFIELNNFKKAREFLREYGHSKETSPTKFGRKRVRHIKALVSMLSHFDTSPWRCAMFHGIVQYPMSYIDWSWHGVTQHYTMSRGRHYWMTRRVSSIADLAQYDWDIPHLERTEVPDGHQSRW